MSDRWEEECVIDDGCAVLLLSDLGVIAVGVGRCLFEVLVVRMLSC